MKWAVIDVETTGLFDFSKPADAPGQPRLAHLAMILTETPAVAGLTDLVIDRYVKPDGWVMDGEAAAVNGLTTEFLEANGLPVAEVLAEYCSYIMDGYAIAAFNSQFDTKVMRGELRRAGMNDLFEHTKNSCLMRASRSLGVQKINGRPGQPGLADVCRHFGIHNDMPHKASADVRAATQILWKLDALGKLPEPVVHYAKNRPEPVNGLQ